MLLLQCDPARLCAVFSLWFGVNYKLFVEALQMRWDFLVRNQ